MMASTKELQEKYEYNVFPRRDIVLVKGSGAKVWDEKGKEYLDCIAGPGVASIGHAHPAIEKAISAQAKILVNCFGVFYNDTKAKLLKKLVQIAPKSLKKAFLCNSGTEAVEAAIKLARYSTGKTDIICAEHAFHGRTLGALSATYNPSYRDIYKPLVPGFHFVPFNDIEAFKKAITERTAAIILELIQGAGGINVADKEFIAEIRKLCDEKDILLIIDEVQTGFCRTGKWFASEHYNLQPDMLCLAKGIASGLPMGALLCSDKIKPLPAGKHGSTFGGNPLCCAASLATIDVMEKEDLAKQAEEKGAYLQKKLMEANLECVKEIRGVGLMLAVETKGDIAPIITKLTAEGVLVLPAGKNAFRLLPPLVISYEELDVLVERIVKVFG